MVRGLLQTVVAKEGGRESFSQSDHISSWQFYYYRSCEELKLSMSVSNAFLGPTCVSFHMIIMCNIDDINELCHKCINYILKIITNAGSMVNSSGVCLCDALVHDTMQSCRSMNQRKVNAVVINLMICPNYRPLKAIK